MINWSVVLKEFYEFCFSQTEKTKWLVRLPRSKNLLMKVISVLRKENTQSRIALKKTLQNRSSSLIRKLPQQWPARSHCGAHQREVPVPGISRSNPAKGSMWRSKPVLLTKWSFSPNFAIVDSCTPDGAPSRFYSTTPHHLSCQVSPKEAFLPWVRIFFPSIVTWCSGYPFKTKESTEQYVMTFSLGPRGCGLALYNHKEVIARFTCNMGFGRSLCGHLIWVETTGLYSWLMDLSFSTAMVSTENAAIEGLYQLVMEQVRNCGSVRINLAECSSHSTKSYFDWPPTKRSWRTNSGIVQHVDVSWRHEPIRHTVTG